MLYKFGVAGMVMVSGFLVPRYLSVPDNGIYKLTQLYFQLAYTYLSGYAGFFNFGLNRKGLDRRQVVAVIMKIYLWIALGMGALLAMALSLVRVDSVFIDAAFAVATVPAAVLFSFSTRLIQSLNEISWLNRLNLAQGLLFLAQALALTFAGRQPGWIQTHLLWLTMLAWLISYAVAAGLAFLSAVKLAGVSFRPAGYPEIAEMVFPYGRRLSFQQLLTQFNLRGDLMLVGLLAGTRASGLYAVAVTASEVLWHISSSISLLVYTRIAKEERNRSIALTERVFRLTVLLLIGAGLGLAAIFPPIIHFLLRGRYDEAIPAFYILILGSVAYGTTALFTQFFTDQLGKVRFPMYMQTASIATNVLVSFLLIPRIYIIGGAVASSAAYYVGLAMNIGYFRLQTGQPLRSLFLFTRADLALFGLGRGRGPMASVAAAPPVAATAVSVAATDTATAADHVALVGTRVAGGLAYNERVTQAGVPSSDGADSGEARSAAPDSAATMPAATDSAESAELQPSELATQALTPSGATTPFAENKEMSPPSDAVAAPVVSELMQAVLGNPQLVELVSEIERLDEEHMKKRETIHATVEQLLASIGKLQSFVDANAKRADEPTKGIESDD